jgi:hypothetical protein
MTQSTPRTRLMVRVLLKAATRSVNHRRFPMTELHAGITTPQYTCISKPLDDHDIAWFTKNMGFSREQLFRYWLAGAKLIKPNDEILGEIVETLLDVEQDDDPPERCFISAFNCESDGGLHVNFARRDADGRWNFNVFRRDRAMARQQADQAVAK